MPGMIREAHNRASIETEGRLFTSFWNSPDQLGAAVKGLTLLVVLSPALFGIALYFVNNRADELQSQRIEMQGNSLRQQDQLVKRQEDTIRRQDDRIKDLTADLQSVRKKTADLAVYAENAERGVSDTYDFNGVHRRRTGEGRLEASVGPETAVFSRIIQLYQSKSWTDLRDLCQEQIRITPAWLTPYLFSGVALANLGDLAKAKDRLKYVASHAGDDPKYADANRILREINASEGH